MTYAMDATTPSGLKNRWTDIFRADTPVHLAMMGSIAVGTFQGWLKDRMGGPIPYAGADLLLIAAILFWFAGLGIRKVKIAAPGNFALGVFALVAVPMLYLIEPGTPFTIQAAGLRSWAVFPICGLLALTVIKNEGQVRAYVGFILILGLVTAVYGILQYRAGPEAALGVSGLAALRHGSTPFYAATGGPRQFRAFSTFTFPAPFAGFMVFAILLATGQVLSTRRPRRQRWMSLLLIPICFVGLTVSGTRAGLVTLLVALALTAWYRGLKLRQMLLLPVLLGALYIASLLTAGQILGRYATLYLDEGQLWTYMFAPLTVAARAIVDNPFGLGLGRSGVGVPFAIALGMPPGYFTFSDGDAGRAAVELGVVGLALLALLVVGLLPYAHRATRAVLAAGDDDLALGIGPLVLGTGILVMIGSPLSTAPHGTIWWFLFGALIKVAMLGRRKAGPRPPGLPPVGR
jgi:hypothetical protein